MEERLQTLDGVYYVMCCKKPDFLVLNTDIYEVLGNWWYSGVHPVALDACRVSASSPHATVQISHNPNLPEKVTEKRGKVKIRCTWEVLVCSDAGESRQYYFATKEGFSQIMPNVQKDLIEYGKEAKYKRSNFESY